MKSDRIENTDSHTDPVVAYLLTHAMANVLANNCLFTCAGHHGLPNVVESG